MRVCGVELKDNDAIICIMQREHGLYDVPKVRATKITLADAVNTEHLKKFQFNFLQLLKDYQVDEIAIKQRDLKGKFAGGAVTFKMEAVLQLLENYPVRLVSTTYIKEGLSLAQVKPDPIELGLKKFQKEAMLTCFAYLEHQADKN